MSSDTTMLMKSPSELENVFIMENDHVIPLKTKSKKVGTMNEGEIGKGGMPF